MTRLMFMTFHGSSRLGQDEHSQLHEVPPVMWLPLATLGVLSLVGGWLNVPEDIARAPLLGWVPSAQWVNHWLAPVTARADGILGSHLGTLRDTAPVGGGPVLWAGISLALAVVSIVLTANALRQRRYRPATESPEPAGLTRLLYRKWYVDEIYDALVVRPVLATSRALWRFIDQGLIDGAVNGAGRVAAALGWVGSRLQSGEVNTYAFAIVVGALLLLGFAVL
jgi:NADH-quinone oxidoreductase subunit L